MSKVRFELDRAGVRALMRSPEMQAVLKERADTVKDRCTAAWVISDLFRMKKECTDCFYKIAAEAPETA